MWNPVAHDLKFLYPAGSDTRRIQEEIRAMDPYGLHEEEEKTQNAQQSGDRLTDS